MFDLDRIIAELRKGVTVSVTVKLATGGVTPGPDPDPPPPPPGNVLIPVPAPPILIDTTSPGGGLLYEFSTSDAAGLPKDATVCVRAAIPDQPFRFTPTGRYEWPDQGVLSVSYFQADKDEDVPLYIHASGVIQYSFGGLTIADEEKAGVKRVDRTVVVRLKAGEYYRVVAATRAPVGEFTELALHLRIGGPDGVPFPSSRTFPQANWKDELRVPEPAPPPPSLYEIPRQPDYRQYRTPWLPAGVTLCPPGYQYDRPADWAVHPNSAAMIRRLGAVGLQPDVGSFLAPDIPHGLPIVWVPAGATGVMLNFYPEESAAAESDPGPYPIPHEDGLLDRALPLENGGYIERGDVHLLLYDDDWLYEIYQYRRRRDGTHWCYAAAKFSLKEARERPPGWTSAEAGGGAISPLLLRYQELADGRVATVKRCAIPLRCIYQGYTFPANHGVRGGRDPDQIPMGARLRLRPGVNLAGLSGDEVVTAVGWQQFGLLVADGTRSEKIFFQGCPDERLNVGGLRRFTAQDFEVMQFVGDLVDVEF